MVTLHTKSYLTEAEKQLPIWGSYDVIVGGGGSAGFPAAVAAARNGAKTLLIEKFGFLGGTATAGLMVEFGTLSNGERQIVGGITHEFIHRMIDFGGCWYHDLEIHRGNTRFCPETYKTIARQMCLESGVDILYHTWIAGVIKENNLIKGVIVENKGGRGVFLGKTVVDCTGDGDIAWQSGVPFSKGNEKGLMQPMTLVFLVGDVNHNRFVEANVDFISIYKEARQNGDLTVPVERPGSIGRVIRKDREDDPERCDYFINGTNILKVDGTNPWELTKAEIEAREQVRELVKVFRKYVPGFEKCYLIETAAHIGVRETRRIKGYYTLTADDVMQYKKFDDRIVLAHNKIDIHETDSHGFDLRILPVGESYQIPYRSIVPQKINNLLVSGRCISATHEALGSTRVMVITMPLGEAAGAAAALIARKGCCAHQLDVSLLQNTLLEQGAILD